MRRYIKLYGGLLVAFLITANWLLAQDGNWRGYPDANAQRGYTPVLFLSVTVAEKNGLVVVDWITSEEHGIKEYRVEKSMDGVNFYPVATQAANKKLQLGNYSYTDAKLWGSIIYYRIKAVDEAGNYFVSPVKIVSLQVKPAISIFPNPVQGTTFVININGDKKQGYQLRLFNSCGQLVMAHSILHTGGFVSYNMQLPQGCLADGFYIAKISGERGQSVATTLLLAK